MIERREDVVYIRETEDKRRAQLRNEMCSMKKMMKVRDKS
jgi:hypothetical protein